MNRTDIEWCDFTWNPVIGCVRSCRNCFAKSIHDRRHLAFNEGKDVPQQYARPFNEVQFLPERLNDPIKRKKPAIIFVVDMGDLFCYPVRDEWIRQIIEVVEKCPQHIFMFLTKDPERYKEFTFPENAWLGVSVSKMEHAWKISQLFGNNNGCKKFVSLEPILGDMNRAYFYEIDLVIIGAMTGPNPDPVNRAWFNELRIDNIFYKENIRRQVTGLPPGSKDQIRNSHLYRKVFNL